jgi:hypothetical protein
MTANELTSFLPQLSEDTLATPAVKVGSQKCPDPSAKLLRRCILPPSPQTTFQSCLCHLLFIGYVAWQLLRYGALWCALVPAMVYCGPLHSVMESCRHRPFVARTRA